MPEAVELSIWEFTMRSTMIIDCWSREQRFQNIGKIIVPKDDSEALAAYVLYLKSLGDGARSQTPIIRKII